MARLRQEPMEIAFYDIGSPNDGGGCVTIALAADLHSMPYADVIAALHRNKPDVICVAGDLLERYRVKGRSRPRGEETYRPSLWKRAAFRAIALLDSAYGHIAGESGEQSDDENAFAFLSDASSIAPTYYALGNHERYFTSGDRRRVKETGAILLDNACETLDIRGCNLMLGGLSTRVDTAFLDRFFSDENAASAPYVRVLMCHHPEYYARHIKPRGSAIVLSGHAHGGQWRIRGRGLYAPGQGFLPKYTDGVFSDGAGGALIVSRGLANTANVSRRNNPTQLVFVNVYY